MNRLAWLWDALAALALLLFQATLVSLWYQVVFEPAGITWGTIFLILFTILSASQAITLGLAALKTRLLLRAGLLVGWFLAAAFLSLKALLFLHTPVRLGELLLTPVNYIIQEGAPGDSFYHLLVIGILVWRGVSMARRPATLGRVQAAFQLGLVALLLYGMLFAPLHAAEATPGLYLYLFFGLVAMSAARVAHLSELRGGRIPRFGARWLAVMLLAGLALVALALMVSWFLSGRVENVLAAVVLVLLAILTLVMLVLISPLLLLLAKAIPFLAGFLSQIVAQLNVLAQRLQAQKLAGDFNRFLQRLVPFLWVARGFLLVLMLALVLLAIYLALRFRQARETLVIEEETSGDGPVEPDSLFRKVIRRALQNAGRIRVGSPARLLAAARIRRIYRELMALSQKMGSARQPSVTPLEFLPQLEGLFPGERPALEQITHAYLKVRYGEYPETHREVQDVEAAWRSVRQRR